MGIFGFGKKASSENAATQENTSGSSGVAISLQKHTISLTKSLDKISLQKDLNISNLKARVIVAMDHSGSMSPEFEGSRKKQSNVQEILNKLFPIALRFDDDGKMDVWLFDSFSNEMPEMTMANYENYVEDTINRKNIPYGGTRYAPVIKDIMDKCLDSNLKSEYPVFVIFITDGENSDPHDTDSIIRKSSNGDIFIQFVGIGTGCDFEYLRALDDLSGRACDNTGFEAFTSLTDVDDETAYEKIISQFIDWSKFKSGN